MKRPVEHRSFKRVHFETDCEVEYRDKTYKGELLDISLKGALLEFPRQPPMKLLEECVLRISLPSSEVIMLFDATLMHLGNNHFGFQFLGFDADTMGHLRRLLELNFGDDADEVDHELFFLLHQ